MLGDSILTALNKMKQTDQQQHSKGLLQEFYAMTQKHEPIGQYAVRLDMAASKVQLQCRVAHLVNRKAANQRPAYYNLIKFALEKEAEINF